jgi:Transposase DDE domain
MYVSPLPDVEKRLQDRYLQLIQEHLAPLEPVAAGLRARPGAADAFAATQAAWRFYHNDGVSRVQLIQPLQERARAAVTDACDAYALVVHDWSFLHYREHSRKRDRIPLGNTKDLGYELLASLVVSDRDGAPLAPVCQQLRAAAGVYSTRCRRVLASRSQLDELGPVLGHVEGLGLGRPAVHIIDAEADSVAHYRRWARRGWLFVVRADETRQVLFDGQECLLSAVVGTLRTRQAFTKARRVDYHGQPTQQWVAEAAVVLHRKAQPHRRGQKRKPVPGRPLPLRLVVSELRDADGTVLERWLLLSNVPVAVLAERVVLWYYWRWRVETYFKLLKGAGQQLERWQQKTAAAVAARLLVASMACVVVWEVARAEGPEAEALRDVLVRLSGRQLHWGKRYTEPALLAGLWVLLAMLALLEHYDLEDLQRLARRARPSSEPHDTG